MALPNKPKGELLADVNPEVVEQDVDVLIIGGGMAACGTAFEIKKWAPEDLKIMLIDKASLERSGAVAQGLSAINTYIGENPIEDYVKMVRNDLMGVVREDLIYDCGRHVDESVKLFEEWGLPVWKKDADGENLDGAFVRDHFEIYQLLLPIRDLAQIEPGVVPYPENLAIGIHIDIAGRQPEELFCGSEKKQTDIVFEQKSELPQTVICCQESQTELCGARNV